MSYPDTGFDYNHLPRSGRIWRTDTGLSGLCMDRGAKWFCGYLHLGERHPHRNPRLPISNGNAGPLYRQCPRPVKFSKGTPCMRNDPHQKFENHFRHGFNCPQTMDREDGEWRPGGQRPAGFFHGGVLPGPQHRPTSVEFRQAPIHPAGWRHRLRFSAVSRKTPWWGGYIQTSANCAALLAAIGSGMPDQWCHPTISRW